MAESALVGLPSSRLFQLCATHPGDDEYWSEFIRRFNPILVRSIAVAWRRCATGNYPSPEAAADLLQDVYTVILKNDLRLLRQFRGDTEAEAEAYLARTATNQTISYLRARSAGKREAEEIPLHSLVENEPGAIPLADHSADPQQRLNERDLIETLRRTFTGPRSERDILILLLHLRDGWTAAEIARMGICELRDTSVANLLTQMKAQLKKTLLNQV
jgi:DNA-directed RNA polymerase specialized sigma24 family protein